MQDQEYQNLARQINVIMGVQEINTAIDFGRFILNTITEINVLHAKIDELGKALADSHLQGDKQSKEVEAKVDSLAKAITLPILECLKSQYINK